MGIGSFLKKIMNKKTGQIVLTKKFNTHNPSITPPLCEDMDGTGSKSVILTTTKGEIFMLDEDANLKWKFTTKEKIGAVEEMFLDSETSNSISQSPRIFDINGDGKKEVLFGTEYGKIYALDINGKVMWSYSTKSAIRGGICVHKDEEKIKIIFGSTDSHLYILDEKGKLAKKINLKSEIESTPTVLNNTIIVGNDNGEILGLDMKGNILWSYKTESKIISEAISIKLRDGRDAIIVGSTDNNLYCIDFTGKLLWVFETEGSIYSAATTHDINDDGKEEIIFGSADNKIYALNLEGTQIWKYETDFWIIGTPVIMDIDKDGRMEVIVGSYDTNVYVLTGEGAYMIDYVPGLSGIVAQSGNYSDIPTDDPGEIVGSKAWEYKTPGLVIGCCKLNDKLIVQTKEGSALWLEHKEGE